MNLTSSHPFWSVNNGLPANYASLQRNVSCDAVVIGGGITGALVAVHLAEAGVKTLVLDKRDIGTGSTSASTALLQYEIDVPLRDLIKQVGSVAATRSYQLWGFRSGPTIWEILPWCSSSWKKCAPYQMTTS